MRVHLHTVVSKGLFVISQTQRLLLSDHNLQCLTHFDKVAYL